MAQPTPLLTTLLHECERHLSHIDAAVDSLRKGTADVEARESIFRGAHTIAGSAAMVGLTRIAACARDLERCAAGIRRDGRPVPPWTLEELQLDLARLYREFHALTPDTIVRRNSSGNAGHP